MSGANGLASVVLLPPIEVAERSVVIEVADVAGITAWAVTVKTNAKARRARTWFPDPQSATAFAANAAQKCGATIIRIAPEAPGSVALAITVERAA